MNNRVFVVGLRISELRGDPQLTLLGNPTRSWALFTKLEKYGFDASLFVDSGTPIEDQIHKQYGHRFIRKPEFFLDAINSATSPLVVVCGTRIHETLTHHPWLLQVRNSRIVLAQCYHNVPDAIPGEFIEQVTAALFVTPKYVRRWNEQYPAIPTSVLTTGENAKRPNASSSNGDAVFVGHIHNASFLKLMSVLAVNDPSRNYHIVSGRIKDPSTREYVAMGKLSDLERQRTFSRLTELVGGTLTTNLAYHFLPPGKEAELLDQVSVGIDYTWGKDWVIDNSKVPYYLSYGLNVLAHLPAPSHRFVTKFDAGNMIEQGAAWKTWAESIAQFGNLSVETKNNRRIEAGQFFDWDNVAFDVAAVLMELQNG